MQNEQISATDAYKEIGANLDYIPTDREALLCFNIHNIFRDMRNSMYRRKYYDRKQRFTSKPRKTPYVYGPISHRA